jgi:hypothetical protein
MHYVYYLLDPESLDLLYIGRSSTPIKRRLAFIQKYGIPVIFGTAQRHADFEAACKAELRAIESHQPKYNKNLVSSPGMYGKAGTVHFQHTEEAKRKIGAHFKNKQVSPEQANRLRMSCYNRLGSHQSLKTIDKRRQALLGQKRSEETKAKLRATWARRKQNALPNPNHF